ncbi:MAG: ABC transporter ATP-binding protein [Clostridia bacterium]|nr:ABC transporter ATP-binding protein [Clostridia bacterium]
MSKKVSAGTLKQVFRHIKRYRLLLIISIVLATLSVAGTLYAPILIGDAIDMIIGVNDVDFEGVAKLLVETGVIALGVAVVQWLMNTVNNKITFHIVRNIRDEAFKKIEILPLSYIDSHPHGDTVSRVIADADQFADGLLMGFTQLFTGVVTILGTLAFMLSINWKIALVVVVLTPLSLFVAKFISEKTYGFFSTQSKIRGEQTAFINEMIENQKVVKAFGREDENIEKFAQINARLEKSSLKATFFSSLVNPTTRFVNSVVYAFVALTGAFAVMGTAFTAGAAFTVGSLSCLLSYANQYTKPFNEISGVITELQNAFACAARLFELIEEEPQIPDKENATVLTDVEGSVKLENVCFSYNKQKKLIENLNLNVKPGQRVAIVGPTGCGKTTLINLLMRFYDVDSGSVSVDNSDIRDITRDSLRHGFGMVLQETWIREGTVKENIAIGKSDATDEEIIAAAKAAHAHSFIKRLPKGYDTPVGESTGGLSQGQKQLLCISRLMLCNPSMLILDEATSSIDTRTEIRIQKAFLKLMQGRTTFIVAHRLSTIREADVILVMRDGSVIEQGNHEELLSKKGFYYELYNSQFDKQ